MLDTLAQSGTTIRQNTTIVNGAGSDLTDGKLITSRAEHKVITQHIAIQLARIAEIKKDKEMKRMVWNTYHCQKRITTTNGRSYSAYCKNKFCCVCLRNRKATIIHDYLPELQTWEEPYFVTLTIKSCSAKRLEEMITRGMVRAFKRIFAKLKKRHQRGVGQEVKGIRTMECNFNPTARTYNPHFHLIVPNKATAQLLIDEWLKLWTPKFALSWAQDMRPIRNLERGLIEVVKYGTKIFTEKNPNRLKRGKKQETKLYVKALYNILKALKPHRLFERFGFNLTQVKREQHKAQLVTQFMEWEYSPLKRDWISTSTSEPLTQFVPSEKLLFQLLQQDNEID